MAPPRGRAGVANEDTPQAEASDSVKPSTDALVCHFPVAQSINATGEL